MTGTARPRAVVTDDSHFMRNVIGDILEDGAIEVVAEARHGREALDAVREHDPDVVTMDVEMPEMDGIEAVERIMAEHPTPILMLSAHTDENADVTFEALERGAVDFFTKPGGEVSMEMSRLEDQLVGIVCSVAGVEASAGAGVARAGATGATATDSPEAHRDDPTLVIGSSTGGPTVVERILSELPRAVDFRVLVVQHMPEGFTERFAARLDDRSDYDVREASDGDRIGGGEALVATGDRHMEVANYSSGRLRVALTDEAPVNSVRPAVDVTMRTAAGTVEGPLTGVILTGMGTDGAAGVKAIHGAGGHVLAQDEATSAVYGMPKRAVETGTVDEVLPVGALTDGILTTIETEA